MIELIAGGARSGKSRYAQQTAESLLGDLVYVATATAGDDSMKARIHDHQVGRGDRWQLIEEPLLLSSVVARAKQDQILLVDCLTLWVTNWLCSDQAQNWAQEKSEFLGNLQKTPSDILLVTNEVGLGVIPMGQLSRDFVDEAGLLHQEVAAIAERVTLITFGIPSQIKP